MDKNVLYLNQDYFYLEYKAQQNLGPDKAGSDKFTKEIFEALDQNENFGHNRQYDDLKRVIAYKPEIKIKLHLFFTEDVNLCWDRADKRFNSGGHYVADKTIFEMYNNTFPLLKTNISLFDDVSLYDVKETGRPRLTS